MFSQEDLDAYNRVQGAMESQTQLERQNRRRGRLARTLAWVFVILFTAAAGVAGYFGYSNYLLYSDLAEWQALSRGQAIELNNLEGRLATTKSHLAEANGNVMTLSQNLATEREARNSDVRKANASIRRLEGDIVGQNREIEAAGKRLQESNRQLQASNEQVSYYIKVNAGLETSVTQLDASVRQLESANNSLTRRNRELDQENDQLVADYNELVDDYNFLLDENETLASDVNALNARVVSLESQLRRARAQQVTIPTCASNYYTITAGRLTCVARDSSAFQSTQTETSTVRLPHSGTVNLRINRSGELGSARSMEILEHAVKTIEEYMGEPIPLKGNEIRLDFVEKLDGPSDFAGVYKGTHMEILQVLDAEPLGLGDDRLAIAIAHEVAHYYWNGGKTWLDEGAAEFLAIYSENKRVGRAMIKTNTACAQASTISYLESRKFEPGDMGFTCNYSLGEGLFLDTYGQMQEGDFQRAFRRLYNSSDNKIAGIYQVRQAFYPGSEWVQEIIDKWYGYREKPEMHLNNGTFLGYMTWEEADGWKLQANRDQEPCATILRLNDQTGGAGYTVRQTRDECYYTGEWYENGGLIVTIDGKEYRAVEVKISGPPSRWDYSISPGI